MLLKIRQDAQIKQLIENDNNCYTIKRLYNKEGELSVVQVLDVCNRICKCLFYENGRNLSNMSLYNPETGKEIKNVTYRNDGITVSSVREYNAATQKLCRVIFYKQDGENPSSVIEYNEEGDESHFTLFCDDGEVIRQSF